MLAALLDEAAQVDRSGRCVDVDDSEFLPPGRHAGAHRAPTAPAPGSPCRRRAAETVRCILDSLALAFRRDGARGAGTVRPKCVEVVHLVGGGAHNALLCQLTADACELPVVAGPVEAAAFGNMLVQARAAGVIEGGLDSMRRLVRATQPLRRYEPSGDDARWRAAAKQLADVRAG